jgi:hypothetical protein
METGDKPSASIGEAGQVTMQRLKTEDGRQAKLVDAPILAGLGISTLELAYAHGSRWADAELRRWESGGSGSVVPFSLGA